MISPSDGIRSPASTRTMSPTLSVVLGISLKFFELVPLNSLALVSVRVRRKASACALPRPFGDRLREIGEQHGEPQPHDDLEFEADMPASGQEIANQNDGGQRRDHFEHEHHRALDQRARIELHERLADRRNHDLGIQQSRDRHAFADMRGFHCNDSEDSIRTACRRPSRDVRRWVRARTRGSRSVRR